MRKMVCGFSVAVFAAAALMFSTPASAADYKPCWAHYDEELDTFDAVWANGGGHQFHENDQSLGSAESRAQCEEWFSLL